MSALVNFPADRDLLHLPAENENHLTGKITAERRYTPCGVCVVLFMGMCLLDQRGFRSKGPITDPMRRQYNPAQGRFAAWATARIRKFPESRMSTPHSEIGRAS